MSLSYNDVIDAIRAALPETEPLTKREWFAGLAMIGNIANSDPTMRPASQKQVAEWSVQLADALLAALEKEPTR